MHRHAIKCHVGQDDFVGKELLWPRLYLNCYGMNQMIQGSYSAVTIGCIAYPPIVNADSVPVHSIVTRMHEGDCGPTNSKKAAQLVSSARYKTERRHSVVLLMHASLASEACSLLNNIVQQ